MKQTHRALHILSDADAIIVICDPTHMAGGWFVGAGSPSATVGAPYCSSRRAYGKERPGGTRAGTTNHYRVYTHPKTCLRFPYNQVVQIRSRRAVRALATSTWKRTEHTKRDAKRGPEAFGAGVTPTVHRRAAPGLQQLRAPSLLIHAQHPRRAPSYSPGLVLVLVPVGLRRVRVRGACRLARAQRRNAVVCGMLHGCRVRPKRWRLNLRHAL